MQGAQVQSLIRELDPTCMLQLRVHMPQLASVSLAGLESKLLPKRHCRVFVLCVCVWCFPVVFVLFLVFGSAVQLAGS